MITITNLSKNFDERMLLDNVSLSIFPNERIGLTGPNGAGKTTCFYMIVGLQSCDKGQIILQGQDITKKCFLSLVFGKFKKAFTFEA